jgi:transcriptional regulator with XRE-family HTH domain
VTPEWLALVQQELRTTGRTQIWLAQRLGVSKGAISQLLSGRGKGSRLVSNICEVLRVPPPQVEEHPTMQRLIAAGRTLLKRDPAQLELVVQFVESAARIEAPDPDPLCSCAGWKGRQ